MSSTASSLPILIAETIQTGSINRAPSPHHDLNPSTAASSKQPVRVSLPTSPSSSSPHSPSSQRTYTTVKPIPRRGNLPPLPDLRFEQSYLASIQNTKDWRGVAWVTVRDQVFLPLIQGTLWTLLLSGWRHWNRTAQFSGQSVGSRIRRWWWDVNNWTIPEDKISTTGGSGSGLGDERLAERVQDFYQDQAGAALD